MARPRKVVQVPPAEAVFIVESMIRDGRIDSTVLDDYRGRYIAEIESLEAQLARLRSLAAPVIPAALETVAAAAPALVRAVKRRGRKAAKAAKRGGRKAAKAVKRAAASVSLELSPERKKTQELQGRYLGLMRQIPKTIMKQRFGKQAIAEKGKAAVVDEMQAYLAARGSKAGGRKKARRGKSKK